MWISCFSSRTGASPPIPMKRGMTAPSPWTSFSRSFPPTERGDYRSPSIEVINGDGSAIFSGKVVDHRIYKGKVPDRGNAFSFGRRIRIRPTPWRSVWRTGKAVRPLPCFTAFLRRRTSLPVPSVLKTAGISFEPEPADVGDGGLPGFGI